MKSVANKSNNDDYNKKQYIQTEESKDKIKNNNIENETRICPFCSETVKKTALVCRFCGKDLRKYDEEMQQKQESEERIKKAELKEKYKDIEGLLKDNKIYSEAKEMRRIYGKNMAIDYLKNKASEIGISCDDITEDCIDDLLGMK